MTDPPKTGSSLAGRAESLPDATVPQRAGTIVKEFIGSIVEEAELRVQQVRDEAVEDAAGERRAAYQSAKQVRERLDAVTKQLAELRAGIRRDSDALSTDPILTGSGLRGALPAAERGGAGARPALGAPAEDPDEGTQSPEAVSEEKSSGWWGKRRGAEPESTADGPEEAAVPDSPEPSPAAEATAEVAAEQPDAGGEADSEAVSTLDPPAEPEPAVDEGAGAGPRAPRTDRTRPSCPIHRSPRPPPTPRRPRVAAEPGPAVDEGAGEQAGRRIASGGGSDAIGARGGGAHGEAPEPAVAETESPVATAERTDGEEASREADTGAVEHGADLSERVSRLSDVELAGPRGDRDDGATGGTRLRSGQVLARRRPRRGRRSFGPPGRSRPRRRCAAGGLVPAMVNWRRDRALASRRDAVRTAKRAP